MIEIMTVGVPTIIVLVILAITSYVIGPKDFVRKIINSRSLTQGGLP